MQQLLWDKDFVIKLSRYDLVFSRSIHKIQLNKCLVGIHYLKTYHNSFGKESKWIGWSSCLTDEIYNLICKPCQNL